MYCIFVAELYLLVCEDRLASSWLDWYLLELLLVCSTGAFGRIFADELNEVLIGTSFAAGA